VQSWKVALDEIQPLILRFQLLNRSPRYDVQIVHGQISEVKLRAPKQEKHTIAALKHDLTGTTCQV
jgi:hypothetical protein